MKNGIKKPVALLFVFALFATACGQKLGVHTRGSQSGPLAAGQDGEVLLDESGQPIPGTGTTASSENGGGGGQSSTTTKKGTTSGGGSGGGGGGSGGGGGGSVAADRTGVSDTKILIGAHAPVTGAAAAPLTDIQNGINLLKDYFDAKNIKIHGRTTETFFRDDQYSPSQATSVCREMAEVKKVFMLIGLGGTDQIVACARYANRNGIPYLSAGVTENELNTFKNYFAFSATYPDQAKPLVSMIKNFTAPIFTPNPGGTADPKVYLDRCNDNGTGCLNDPTTPLPRPAGGYGNTPKVAMIYSDTEGFIDAKKAFDEEFFKVFGTHPIFEAITKFNLDSTTAQTLMTKFRNDGIDVVYVLTAPTNWLELLSRAVQQRFFGRWIGVGVTKGLDIVASVACTTNRRPAFENSLFFSPFFSVRHSDAAKEFKTAWDDHGSVNDDYRSHDLAFGVWGGSIVQAALLHAAGRDLTRQGFIAALEKLKNYRFPDQAMGINMTDVFTTLNYSSNYLSGGHFGGQQVHLLWGNCTAAAGSTAYWDYFQGQGHFVTGF